jgi:hypothetical protein
MMKKNQRALARRPAPSLTASIETRIFMIRGQKVIVDSDLADLYRVPTKVSTKALNAISNVFQKTSCSSSPAKR